MLRLVILGLVLGSTLAQFPRSFNFGTRRDSPEDRSDERFFGSNRNFGRHFDDSREDNFVSRESRESRDRSDERRRFGRTQNNFIRRDFDDSPERISFGRNTNFVRRNFDDSPERSFGVNRNFIRRDFDDSPERTFGGNRNRNRNFLRRDSDESDERRFRGNFNSVRRRFNDSPEDNFIGSRPFGGRRFDNSRSRFNTIGRTHQTVGQNFGTRQTVGSPNFFTRQNFGRTPTRNFIDDSIEDVIEDLFDDDLDDRLRAQHALSHFQSPGTGSFSTRGTTSGFSFGTASAGRRTQPNTFGRTPNNILRNQNTPGAFAFRTSFGQNNNNNNNRRTTFPSSTQSRTPNQPRRFSTSTQSRTPKQPRFSTSTQSRTPKQPRFSTSAQSGTPKQPRRFSVNSIRNQGTSSKPSKPSSRSPRIFGNTGFNWPGGNGYFVSMRTGTGKPTTYFVKFDD